MNYEVFYETFLSEMPWRINGSNDFEFQLSALHEMLGDGHEVTHVADSIFKIHADTQITYWVGDDEASSVLMIVDTSLNGNICKISLTSKNPELPPKSPPYASSVYLTIMHDLKADHVALSSDQMLSDDAIKLWGRLVTAGHTVSVFNTATHQYELAKVSTADELEQYLGGANKQHYVFIISESDRNRSGLRHSVAIMEIKRNSGYPLAKLFESYRKKL